MTATILVSTLAVRGVRLSAKGDRLVIDAPRDALTAEDREELRAHKAELIALVSAPDPLDALRGPRRTRWNTLVWSDPGEPPIELFGPCP